MCSLEVYIKSFGGFARTPSNPPCLRARSRQRMFAILHQGRFAFSRLEIGTMSSFFSVETMLHLVLSDFTTQLEKYTFCMPQFCHNFVQELLELETIISTSSTVGFLKVQISLSDQLDDLSQGKFLLFGSNLVGIVLWQFAQEQFHPSCSTPPAPPCMQCQCHHFFLTSTNITVICMLPTCIYGLQELIIIAN